MRRALGRIARLSGAETTTGVHRHVVSAIASAMAVLVVLLNAAAPAYAQCAGKWTRRMPAAAPLARSNHQLAYDSARGVSVLFGGGYGDSTSGMNNETWEWNGTNWSQKSPAAAPSARTSYGMAYDSGRGVTVLFGGYDDATNAENGETWEWNGTNWSQKFPVPAPSARYYPAMAYDSGRGVTVLFGGNDGMDPLADTWEWNGTNWVLKLTALAPSARTGHGMAYDSARGVTVLFGGDLNAETWEWNGSIWSKKSPAAAPSARFYPPLPYDSARGVTVLFGGLPSNNEMWEWNGTNWSQKLLASTPSARFYHAMAYDSGRNVTVLFGGVVNGPANSQETWEWSVPTLQISQQPSAQTVGVGQAAMFSVAAEGPAPLSYQWRVNGTALADGGTLSGTATEMLIINPAATENSGIYHCEVSSPDCEAVPSESAELVVDPCKVVDPADDADGSGVVDSCEAATSGACGACGAGVPLTMTLGAVMFIGARFRRRR